MTQKSLSSSHLLARTAVGRTSGLGLNADLRFNDVLELNAHHAEVPSCALSDLSGLGAHRRQ